MERALDQGDAGIPAWLAGLGLPGMVDVHVHFMPDTVQQKVWAHFDRLDPPWPVTYRSGERRRLATLAAMGIRHHTALAYSHRPGMAEWLNRHTLGLARSAPAVVPSFTFYPEPGVEEYVQHALDQGGAAAKVHLQVGKFDANHPLLDPVWSHLAAGQVPVILHAGAVRDGSGGEEWCGIRPVRRLLDRFPELRLVIAHLGAPDFDDFIDLARGSANVSLDTAMVFDGDATLGARPPDLGERLGRLGGQVVFGSDFPTIPRPVAAQLAGLAALGLGDDWLRAVLWHNGARLLGIDGAGW
ncbi:MAG TPA: amidohydrolase family protein [Actinomycetes bacterium]|nr:amidohydrolase family protein [Actinomycetes bacterium]